MNQLQGVDVVPSGHRSGWEETLLVLTARASEKT